MANYSFFALPEASLTVSGGGSLDGITQGDGSHLVGRTITLNQTDFEEIFVSDNGSDDDFDDNDGNQRLDGAQSFGGSSYGNGTRIEAEYQIVLRDPNTGVEYRAVAVNFNNSSPAYGTIEGLAFVDAVPPTGVALQVVSAAEGPGASGQPALGEIRIVPVCFSAGTRIATPSGPRAVERLAPGDLVLTADRGAQPVRLVHGRRLGVAHLARCPRHGPVRIEAGALGSGLPERPLVVSPQHRLVLSAPVARRMFGSDEVLAPAAQLVGWPGIARAQAPDGVHYVHLLLDHHAVLFAEGAAAESLLLGPVAEAMLPAGRLAPLQARGLLPAAMAPARPLAEGPRLRRLLERLARNRRPLAGAWPEDRLRNTG